MTSPADTLTVQQLDHLAGLLAAATPGPWINEIRAITVPGISEIPVVAEDFGMCRAADTRLIVALRNAAPALLATVRRQQAALDAVTELHREETWLGVPDEPHCGECTSELHDAGWPCPTIRALRTALASPAPTEATT